MKLWYMEPVFNIAIGNSLPLFVLTKPKLPKTQY